MEIKSLRYFLAVAREENMTKAADMLHVTQPTLSKTLKYPAFTPIADRFLAQIKDSFS